MALICLSKDVIAKTNYMLTQKITLINQELKEKFSSNGSQKDLQDPMLIAKFFNPCGSQTWYAISYDEESHCCFGYVTGMFEDELGYFSMDELESLRIPPMGIRIERDLYFSPCRLSEIENEPS